MSGWQQTEGRLSSLKVMCARSMHVAAGALGGAFATAAGHQVEFDFDTVGALEAKLAGGANADLVILSASAIGKLEGAGALVAGSRRNVAKTFIALCVKEGAPIPEFGTAEAFRRLIESADAIALSDPGVGGSAGVHLVKAFEAAGLAAVINAKGMPQKTGAEVARRVVEGKAPFGLTLSGEVASVPGAVIAGPLPPPFGQDTIYCGAVTAGSTSKDAAAALLAALTAPETRETWRRCGFEAPLRVTA
jgi:molybdate transport system substrate-binding protein